MRAAAPLVVVALAAATSIAPKAEAATSCSSITVALDPSLPADLAATITGCPAEVKHDLAACIAALVGLPLGGDGDVRVRITGALARERSEGAQKNCASLLIHIADWHESKPTTLTAHDCGAPLVDEFPDSSYQKAIAGVRTQLPKVWSDAAAFVSARSETARVTISPPDAQASFLFDVGDDIARTLPGPDAERTVRCLLPSTTLRARLQTAQTTTPPLAVAVSSPTPIPLAVASSTSSPTTSVSVTITSPEATSKPAAKEKTGLAWVADEIKTLTAIVVAIGGFFGFFLRWRQKAPRFTVSFDEKNARKLVVRTVSSSMETAEDAQVVVRLGPLDALRGGAHHDLPLRALGDAVDTDKTSEVLTREGVSIDDEGVPLRLTQDVTGHVVCVEIVGTWSTPVLVRAKVERAVVRIAPPAPPPEASPHHD